MISFASFKFSQGLKWQITILAIVCYKHKSADRLRLFAKSDCGFGRRRLQ